MQGARSWRATCACYFSTSSYRGAGQPGAQAQWPFAPDRQLLFSWNGKIFKTHPVTGALMPEDAAREPQRLRILYGLARFFN